MDKAEGMGQSETHLAGRDVRSSSRRMSRVNRVVNSGNLLKEDPACVRGSGTCEKTNYTPVVSIKDSSIGGYRAQGEKTFQQRSPGAGDDCGVEI